MNPRIPEPLRTQHPFTLLSEAEHRRLGEAVCVRTYRAGERILVQDGPVSECLYLLTEGRARLVRDGHDVKLLETGDLFGYPSLINHAPPCCDVVARGEVTVHCLPADAFRELLTNAGFAEFFVEGLGERLQRLVSAPQALGGELTSALADLPPRRPVRVPSVATVSQAARAMRDAGDDVALIEGEQLGILTDHDFQVRVLAEGLGPDTPVGDVASTPIKTLPADTPVHAALLFMLENRIRHLPVTSGVGISGVVSATDLLRHQTRNPLYLMERLERIDNPNALKSYPADAAAMVERLFAGGLMVGQIGRVLASLNDRLVRRLCTLAEHVLGPPPCPYAWLVFGSEGRMEQTLLTDQDNALVYETPSPEAETYFRALAERVVEQLVMAGFPLCTGGCMATNWNQPLEQWRETVAGWIREPTPDNLMVSSIFFDFRAVAGELDTAPLADVVAGAQDNQLFLAHLARVSLRFKPPLDLFQRIRTEGGSVDLKKRGIASIAAAARVYALEAGERARPTRERLEAAIESGVVSDDLGRNLIQTYRFLLRLRLGAQLRALKEGRPMDNDIRLKELPSLERRHLKDAFGAIREMQQAVRQRYKTDTLG